MRNDEEVMMNAGKMAACAVNVVMKQHEEREVKLKAEYAELLAHLKEYADQNDDLVCECCDRVIVHGEEYYPVRMPDDPHCDECAGAVDG